MKNILVIYFSQTGQLTRIINSVLAPLKEQNNLNLIFEELQPKTPFPFPWGAMNFFNAMPEAVKEIPCGLEPFSFNSSEEFDLVIIAYQPWYLSPSIPVSSFLQSEQGQKVIRGKPVVTIVGCRNMWLNAQEKVKKRIYGAGGSLVGNIVLADKAGNLISLITAIGWLIHGKKSGFLKVFPESGVSETDIKNAERFGKPIIDALKSNQWDNLQTILNNGGAVEINPSLMVLEGRGAKAFKIWADFIGSKGKPGDPRRRFRVFLLLILLPLGVFILSPITALLTFLKIKFSKGSIEKQVQYYLSNKFAE